MTLLEAIKARHSVRQFTERPIEPEKVALLQKEVERINAESGLHFQLLTEEPVAFSSKLAHYGKFRNVRNYFAIIGRKSEENNEKAGYFGEELVLLAQTLGLNTCWVGLTYKKNPSVLHIEKGEHVICLIALGYGENQGVLHRSKPLKKVATSEHEMPEWFRNGVEAALLAPTALNQQKFRITLRADNSVEFSKGWGFYTATDLGIIKKHFEIGAQGGGK
ncbi:MAG: nitroreductase family protein [Bacteroidaceae bacterium]|nr:nitroreductase family protein [Bacteroidaceae bacterium]